MGKQEKCKVHYCTNEREFGKNGQLMNYCSHCKKLNLLNKSGTWENPHIIFKNNIIFNDITALKCNYDFWQDGTKCGDTKQKYLAVPDIDKKWVWGMFDVDHIKKPTKWDIKNNKWYCAHTGKIEHPSNYQLICKDCHRVKSHRNGDYDGSKNKKTKLN
jgi:hypothetical protein